MRRLILIFTTLLTWTMGYTLTIELDDYGYADGKIRNYSQGPWDSSGTDLSEGTNKSWSFSMPSEGYVNNSYHGVQNVSSFPGANMSAVYDQYTLGYSTNGTLYYQITGSDILNIGYTGYPNLVWDPPVPMGLPHYLGKTWTGTHAWAYGSYNVNGKVLAEGQVSTPLGSYPALLVRYFYQTSAISYYYYQWETKDYGIIAYTMTLNDGMLYVLNQAEPNQFSDNCLVQNQNLVARLSPHPFVNGVTLRLESKHSQPASVSIYDIKGRFICRNECTLRAGEESQLELSDSFTNQPAGLYLCLVKAGDERQLLKVTKIP